MIRYTIKPSQPQEILDSEPFHRYLFDDGTVWTEFHRCSESYLLRFPKLADFSVSSDGAEVAAFPAVGVDDATVEHLYINQLVPLALSRQGCPTFHASVVTVEGGAIAFLGKTGTGKSTLAASFALNNGQFLTDDALMIEEDTGACVAIPSHASLRLWGDSVEALLDSRSKQAPPISYSTKARLIAGKALAYNNNPQILLAAFVLHDQNVQNIGIQDLAGLDRYMAWMRNSFLLDIEDRELLTRHFEWTDRISATVATFSLDYPRDYGILPDLRQTIRSHIANLGQ